MTTLWADHALTDDGWQRGVSITIGGDGRITDLTAGADAAGARYDCLLAAPVNAHSHAFQRAMAGLAERRGPDPRDTFWTWRKLMYRFMDTLTPDQVEAIAAFVQMEMLEAGYATNVEFHYLHHQRDGTPYADLAELSGRIAAAARQTGIGLTLLPVHYQFGGCDGRPLGQGQIRFGNDRDRYAGLCEGARKYIADGPADWGFGIAPHSLRAVAPEDLKQAAGLAPDGPVHMHLAEQIPEVEEVQAAWGARPVEWALDNLDLDHRWNLVHCTQMQTHETVGLARSGATAVLCPVTESNLGDGIFDGLTWLGEGGSTSVGSDSNIRISLAEELRTLDYSQRLRDNSRAALATGELSTARAMIDRITRGGARSAGRETGLLAVGQWADILALDLGAPDFDGLSGDAILDTYVFAADDRIVSDVWAAGRHMVRGGRHIDRDGIVDAYRAATAGLRDAL